MKFIQKSLKRKRNKDRTKKLINELTSLGRTLARTRWESLKECDQTLILHNETAQAIIWNTEGRLPLPNKTLEECIRRSPKTALSISWLFEFLAPELQAHCIRQAPLDAFRQPKSSGLMNRPGYPTIGECLLKMNAKQINSAYQLEPLKILHYLRQNCEPKLALHLLAKNNELNPEINEAIATHI